MSKLFENKYYKQLFGNDMEESMEEPRMEKKRQQRAGRREEESSVDSDATETTRDRLERIFGGAGKKGMKKGQHLMAKPRVTGVRKSDAEILREGKVEDAGRDASGRQQFRFKNGAIAVRDDNGRFIIRQGASAAYMDGLRAKPRAAKPLVSNEKAGKAFAAYWNRKMREAKSFDRKNKLKGKDSRAAAVKRSKTYHMKYSHSDASRHLDNTSPKGYLYLRKERVYRNKDGSVSVGKNGKPRVRRAGPAIYDFIGVAPRSVNPRKGSVPRDRIQAALAGKRASLAASKSARNSMRSSSRARAASSDDAIVMRNAWISAKKDAFAAARVPNMAPHVGVPSRAKGVKRGPMSDEAKARALAKRRATLAAKASSPAASKKPRSPRKDKGVKRGPMSAETKAKIAATRAAKKSQK
jgi:hypothetical protein